MRVRNEELKCNKTGNARKMWHSGAFVQHCCSGKAISITYSECVSVALVIQHAMRMRHISIVAWPAVPYFSKLSQKRRDLKKKSFWTQNVCFDFLYNFCLQHLSFWEELSEIWSKMCIGLHVKHSLFLLQFNGTGIFCTVFRKILKYQILIQSIQWEWSCSVRTDRQTSRS